MVEQVITVLQEGEQEQELAITQESGYSAGYNVGYSKGHDDGYGDGYNDGYDEGYVIGYDDGLANAGGTYEKGYNDGYTEGRTKGHEEGYEEGYGVGYGEGHDLGHDEGYSKGRTDGYNEGYTQGRADGYSEGYEKGRTDGYSEGYSKGHTDGYDEGYGKGYDTGKTDGQQIGYENGYTEGKNQGYTEGKNQGYTEGYSEGEFAGKEQVNEIMYSIIDRTGTELNINASTFGNGAFYNWTTLEKARLPLGQLFVAYSFRACSGLMTLDVGDPARTDIYTNAESLYFRTNSFNGASSLTSLILRPNIVAGLQSTSAFTGTPILSGTGYIYVPASKLNEYRSATNWSSLADQIRAIEDYPEITGGAV